MGRVTYTEFCGCGPAKVIEQLASYIYSCKTDMRACTLLQVAAARMSMHGVIFSN